MSLASVVAFVDRLRSNTGKIAVVVSLVAVQSMFLSAFTYAQEGEIAPINAVSVYEDTENLKYAVTGDEGASIHSLKGNELTANAMTGVELLCGVECFEGGQERAEEVGLSYATRSGLLGVTEDGITSMIQNSPGLNLGEHLANQWLPSSDTNTGTFAQGAGYKLLQNSGMEQVWEMFRNIAYAGFVFIIIASGFMIMFRSKIGGQTSVNIMNTLPNILIGLVVVTFSFAIVGFVLDLGRLVTALLSSYMSSALNGSGFQVTGIGDPIQMARWAFTAASPGNLDPEQALAVSLTGIIGFSPLGFLFGGSADVGILGWGLIGILVVLVLTAIAFYASIRVFITLITSYIKIILDLVLGPLYILMGSLPGKQNSITDWLKRLIANAMVFPLVFFIINLSRYIGHGGMQTGATSGIDFMSAGTAVPSGMSFNGLLAIAGYFLAASAPAIVQDLIGVEDSKGLQKALGESSKAASKIPLVGGVFS